MAYRKKNTVSSGMHQEISAILIDLSSAQRRNSTISFFKHDIKCYGVSNPDSQKIGRKYIRRLKKHTKENILDICEELFRSEYLEESLIACQITFAQKEHFTERDIDTFERWINNYINNWAECDTFCNKVIGEMMFRFPNTVERVKSWSLSENLWVRRASAVSFIYPGKRNTYVDDQFEIALILLEDTEDMVQKGYGWMLKVLSSARLNEVFQFVQTYKARMPRTALRYAIEKMPPELKMEAMKK
jgi:3-methyladenine DNA glycosylase AlkD